VRSPKATQPEVEFEQSAAAAPADQVALGIRSFMCFGT
jgi:hypothetical protein